jgi:hypothetical protein
VQKSGNFPSSVIVSGVSAVDERPVTGGGFADIWRGQAKGTLVALKVLRLFGQIENLTTASNVGWSCITNHLSYIIAGAPSRGYDMEILQERECLSILWRMRRRVRSSYRAGIALV